MAAPAPRSAPSRPAPSPPRPGPGLTLRQVLDALEGLTVTAVKDSGEWNLEAGALVLADAGLCCIDEFNSLKEHDRTSIHEAMEQQTISVAKAGLVCKLNTRTTILAATNPKGQYDPHESVSVNIALGSPLLSRFDLILVLLDTRNEDWDRVISSFILENKGYPSKSETLWSMERMKTYFCLIRTLQPRLSHEGNQVLLRYYQLQRQSDSRNAARTTIRLLESLIRLAEAHARLMFRDTVTLEDAVTVVSVMESSMQGGALLGGVNALHTSFPEDPLEQYRRQCELILEALKLPGLLGEELARLQRLRDQSGAPSQQPAVGSQWTPEPLSTEPGEENPLRTSTPQDRSHGPHFSSPGDRPGGNPPGDPSSDLEPSGARRELPAERRMNRDGGVGQCDPEVTPRSRQRNAVPAPRSPETAAGTRTLKPRHKRPGEERKELGDPGQLRAPGEMEGPSRPGAPEGDKATAVSAGEPNSAATRHTPRKPPKPPQGRGLRRGRATVAPSRPTSPSRGSPVPRPERKRRKSLALADAPDLESAEGQGPPVAKLAKFTFIRKSRLTHSPEGRSREPPGTAEEGGESPDCSPCRPGGEMTLPGRGAAGPMSPSGARSSDPLLGSAEELPLPGRPREKRETLAKTAEPEAGRLHLPRERDGRQLPSSAGSGKVHARTLAKLASFSFSSSSESNTAATPPPESKGCRVEAPPPPAAPVAPACGGTRRTFQLHSAAETSALSGPALFSLSELDDEALEVDWEEELKRRPSP